MRRPSDSLRLLPSTSSHHVHQTPTHRDNPPSCSDSQPAMSSSLRLLFVSSLLVSVRSQQTSLTPRPPPSVLLQGCKPEVLLVKGFRQMQSMCRTQPAVAVAALEGIDEVIQECRSKLRFQTWDCSQFTAFYREPPVLHKGYRESALMWALTAAGSAWGVATACAEGWIDECACTDNNKEWKWNGCSYGVQFGLVSSRKILTRSSPLTQSPLRRIEKHNQKAVKKTMESKCKCHGVSGSCQQKTCWKTTATLPHITSYLIEKYRRAKEVQMESGEELKGRNAELVFAESSPDPCAVENRVPRLCAWRNETHSEGNCSALCCGRGHSITHEARAYKCDCKLTSWCCQVVCNECLQHRWLSTCNP